MVSKPQKEAPYSSAFSTFPDVRQTRKFNTPISMSLSKDAFQLLNSVADLMIKAVITKELHDELQATATKVAIRKFVTHQLI